MKKLVKVTAFTIVLVMIMVCTSCAPKWCPAMEEALYEVHPDAEIYDELVIRDQFMYLLKIPSSSKNYLQARRGTISGRGYRLKPKKCIDAGMWDISVEDGSVYISGQCEFYKDYVLVDFCCFCNSGEEKNIEYFDSLNSEISMFSDHGIVVYEYSDLNKDLELYVNCDGKIYRFMDGKLISEMPEALKETIFVYANLNEYMEELNNYCTEPVL